MGSIGAISAFGSQAVQQRLQQSNVAKPLTALEHAKKIRMGPVGKTEQALHLEKALEMAKNGHVKEISSRQSNPRGVRRSGKGEFTFDAHQEEERAALRPNGCVGNPLAQPGPAKQKTATDGMGRR